MEAAASAPANPRPATARLVVKPTVYHQVSNRQPTLADILPTVRQIASDEPPWSRDFVVKGEWQSIRGCWFIDENKPTSLIVLTNREGRFSQTIPTPEERKQAEAKVVLVLLAKPVEEVLVSKEVKAPRDSFSCEAELFTVAPHPPLLLVPGGLLILEPSDLKDLRLRCPFGDAKITAWVFPG